MTKTSEEKSVLLSELYAEYVEDVRKAPQAENAGGFSFVLGDGSADSRVVLIGEAPGKDEVAEGRPFVGKAGGILNEFMEGAGIVRGELFITNVIKYRLAREGKNGRGLANRPAKIKEIKQSSVYLLKELQIIKPSFVVTLGNVPLKALTMCIELENTCLREAEPKGEKELLLNELCKGIGECHGKAFENALADGAVLVPLYHPASTIYNRSLQEVYENDVRKLNQYIKGIGLKK